MSDLNELRHLIGILLNNWTALKIVMYEKQVSNSTMNLQLEKLINIFITGFVKSQRRNYTHEDLADDLQDFMYLEYDTLLEDDSDNQIAFDFFEIYKMLQNDEKEKLKEFLTKFQLTESILNGMKFEVSKYVKVEAIEPDMEGTSADISILRQYENGAEMSEPNSSVSQVENQCEDPDGWKVVNRRKKTH